VPILKRCKKISLNNCGLPNTIGGVLYSDQWEEVHIGRNCLQRAVLDLCNMPQLKVLDLSYNQVSGEDMMLFYSNLNLDDPKKLIISGNGGEMDDNTPIITFCSKLASWASLKHLGLGDLDFNSCQVNLIIDTIISNDCPITTMDLSYIDNCEGIERLIKNLPSLRILDLSGVDVPSSVVLLAKESHVKIIA